LVDAVVVICFIETPDMFAECVVVAEREEVKSRSVTNSVAVSSVNMSQ
jgi:hypothetical protein